MTLAGTRAKCMVEEAPPTRRLLVLSEWNMLTPTLLGWTLILTPLLSLGTILSVEKEAR